VAVPGVSVEGLAQLRRDLKAVEKTLPRELTTTLRRAAQPVARTAAELAPRGKTGDLERSIKAGAAGTRATIRSRLPYANVIAWGGTTGKGHRPGVGGSGSVKVKPSLFPEKAADEKSEQFLNELADGLENLLGRHGFK
jgi:phage gpG-like protein